MSIDELDLRVFGSEATFEWVRRFEGNSAREPSANQDEVVAKVRAFYLGTNPIRRLLSWLGFFSAAHFQRIVVFDDAFFEYSDENPFSIFKTLRDRLAGYPLIIVLLTSRGDRFRTLSIQQGATIAFDPTLESTPHLADQIRSHIASYRRLSAPAEQSKMIGKWTLAALIGVGIPATAQIFAGIALHYIVPSIQKPSVNSAVVVSQGEPQSTVENLSNNDASQGVVETNDDGMSDNDASQGTAEADAHGLSNNDAK